MSRIGNKIIKLEEGVTVNASPGILLKWRSPRGTIPRTFHKDMKIEVKDNEITGDPSGAIPIRHKELHGTTRSLIDNMVQGVTQGFTKILEIHGTGYRASLRATPW